MDLISVAAAYGVVVAVFEWGWGVTWLGLDGPIAIDSYVPMMMFAVLFGLSMDYEVFLLSAIREHRIASGDTLVAVRRGLAETGGIITAAALIMVAVFSSFVLMNDPVVKVFGLGLAVAVVVDATLVRCILVPALMVLLGEANWWLPRWMGGGLPAGTAQQVSPRPA
jgi:RND superfamily putative drug exporter